ncbi:DNA replication and repair protein RecF [Oxobacter pfennigii]|uniref:DNA replication and repair protein RecF n=1 Tax=Oxobacter pfennigii TaxID=36849 RepID=A0A0P9ACZ0_9CLOT|nr:DNA replication/repair protein RecF [Oxobacter pfennigii]KPU42958.1 DNA replication and repair protein RecF [Oxobacter pfennigii]
MYVSRMALQNYRNYDKLSLHLHPRLNIFFGNNAQGKTNLVESIYMCGTGRSHRTFKDKEIIRWDTSISSIKNEVVKKEMVTTIEINLFDGKAKNIKVGGVRIDKMSDLFGNLNVVMFSPEDLKLVKEGPVFRRRFLDVEISQVKPNYFYNLNQYNKVLLQRNNLLKSIKYDNSLTKTLDVWDEQLSQYGSYIITYRLDFIKKIGILAKLIHRKITNGKEELSISYSTQFKGVSNREDLKIGIYKKLIERRQEDIRRGITTVGPHRDDMDFYINNIDVKTYGSQGQQRTTALSLKLSELEFIKSECSEYPVLLLDDVLSELDINRQKFLLDSLKNIQTIITCTSINDIIEFRKNDRYLFEVIEGKINKIEE